MTMKFYQIDLEQGGVTRTVRVPSETDVQAADAAAPLMKAGERIVAIRQVVDDGLQKADALPPVSQAEAFAEITPGAAAKGPPPAS